MPRMSSRSLFWVEVVAKDGAMLSCYLDLRLHEDRWVAERAIDENFSEGAKIAIRL